LPIRVKQTSQTNLKLNLRWRNPAEIFVAIVCIVFAANASAESAKGEWSIEPSGRAWIELYNPHDDTTLFETGTEVCAIINTPGITRLAFRATLLSQAGHKYSTDPDEPRTPVDILHQGWIYGFAGEVRTRIPLQLVIQRDCYHFIDKSGFDPVLWTTVLAGAGTWMPYESRVIPFDFEGNRVQSKWYFLVGRSIRLEQNSAWSSNSIIDLEVWSGYSARKNLNRNLLWDFGGNWNIQFTKEYDHDARSEVVTETGITWHAGDGGRRLSLGRRWHDDRFLWPTRDKNFLGLEFVF
jgi:hypothetical protein